MKSLIVPRWILILCLPLFPQVQGDSTRKNPTEIRIPADNGRTVALDKIGLTRIVFRDGSIKKACKLKEIHDLWIVYVKNEVLHDQMIDKIERIEISTEKFPAIVFDEKGKSSIVEWEQGE